MENTDELKNKLRELDRQAAELFERRMKLVASLSDANRELGLPCAGNELPSDDAVHDSVIREYYVRHMHDLFEISKDYQRRLDGERTVAYCGAEGAFAHICANRIFPDAKLISCGSFGAAYDSVCSGESDSAVLPIENSYNGEVGDVLDLIFFGSLYVNGVYELTVRQNLLGVPGAGISDIERVYSHPQALAQCSGYLHRHGFEPVEYSNTALAAEYVAQLGNVHTAAIASTDTAKIYGLEVLDKNINADSRNTTRFAVLSRAEDTGLGKGVGDHFILVFTARNEAGTLAAALDILGRKYGFNMHSMHSRPVKELIWQYYFYIEAEGNIRSEAGRQMLRELEPFCERLKVAGTYSAHSVL